MPPLSEMEGPSMSMSLGVAKILVDDNTSDACGGVGGGWSVDEEACDMCGGEGEGGQGGSMDEESHGDMCGGEAGGSLDEVAHDTCKK